MKKILFVSLCFISFFLSSQNPLFQWARHFQGITFGNYGVGRSIVTDKNGNVYTTGDFLYCADFDPGPGTYNLCSITGQPDVFISKLDVSGNLIWAKSFGGGGADFAYSLELDNSGNIYITGSFMGTCDFDPGPSVFNLSSSGSDWDVFISKFDSAGNFVFAKTFGGDEDDFGFSIKVDSLKNIYAVGNFKKTVDFDPGPGTFSITNSSGNSNIFITKFDSLGEFIFAKTINAFTGDQYGNGGKYLALDSLNNIYITGAFSGIIDFNPGVPTFNLNSSTGNDAFILKLDAQGNFISAKNFGGLNGMPGSSIELDMLGNIYLTGPFSGNVDFDPGINVFNLTSKGLTDIYISKLDAAGNFVWAKSIGGKNDDISSGIDIDVSGSIYFTGMFSDTVDFDPGSNSFTLATNYTSAIPTDVFVSKLDALGNFLWAKSFKGITYDNSYSIFVDESKNIYTTGNFGNIVDFDPEVSVYSLQSFGVNIFIHKMGGCCVGLNENSEDSNFIIYPNPISDKLIIDNNKSFNKLLITITDLTGKIIKVEKLNYNLNNEIDVHELISGFYILNITSKEINCTKKFIKE